MKKLTLVVDMYGCPNQCKHCWLGHMPNRKMDSKTDEILVEYFKPYFESITYYSWLREPDYCDEYKQRWLKDNEISVNAKPLRFELASFYRLVHDEEYVKFLKYDAKELVSKVVEGDTYALNAVKGLTYSELAKKYGDTSSTKVFRLDDYKMYLVNRYLDGCGK